MPVGFTLNGMSVVANSDETLIETAKRYGVEIPHLCYKEGMREDGNCRACSSSTIFWLRSARALLVVTSIPSLG